MIRRLLYALVIAVALVLPTVAAADAPVWRSYSNGNWINDVATDGDYVWAATGGGVVRWNRLDGSHTKYTTADGLIDNVVECVAIGSDGSKWFGTPTGISRLQGTSWTDYTSAYRPGSSGNFYLRRVQDLAVDGNGTVWAAFSSGGASFDGTKWNVLLDAGGSRLAESTGVAFEGAAKWFSTWGDGLVRVEGSTWTSYTEASTGGALPRDWLDAVAVDSSGAKWLATDIGDVYRLSGSTWTTYDSANTGLLQFGGVTSIGIESANSIWFAGRQGVYHYDGVNWVGYTAADGLAYDVADGIAFDSGGSQWFGTRGGGLSRRDGSNWTTYFINGEQPPRNEISDIAVDGAGSKWFGTLNGVVRFDGAAWTTFYSGENVESVYWDGANSIWLGTYGLGHAIRRFDGTTWTTYTPADGAPDEQIHAIFRDSHGVMWFGTSSGLFRLEGGAWSTITTANGLANNYVHDIFEDRDGNLWFATGGGGVSKLSGAWDTLANWTTYNTANSGLDYAWVFAIEQDAAGAMWFGHGSGASRFGGGNWASYDTHQGLGSFGQAAVFDIAIDGNGVLWLASAGGLGRHAGGRFSTYTTADGLASLELVALEIDHAGHLWLGTYGGITEVTALPSDAFTYLPLMLAAR